MIAPHPSGSVLIERYEYETRRGGIGVQWVLYFVGGDGEWWHYGAYETRHQALTQADGLQKWPGVSVSLGEQP